MSFERIELGVFVEILSPEAVEELASAAVVVVGKAVVPKK
jgi:hypothetical protein